MQLNQIINPNKQLCAPLMTCAASKHIHRTSLIILVCNSLLVSEYHINSSNIVINRSLCYIIIDQMHLSS